MGVDEVVDQQHRLRRCYIVDRERVSHVRELLPGVRELRARKLLHDPARV
jgi:hypothetical protein